jgi:hypothetical protein
LHGGVIKGLQEMHEGNTQLGKPRHMWWDNIKRDVKKIEMQASTTLTWLTIGTSGGLL